MVKDIFGATKTKRNGPEPPSEYPVGYLFEILKDFVDDCKLVVKFFHNHHVPKAQLEKEQNAAGARTLVRPAVTRWGTIQVMAETVLGSERLLHGIVMTRDFLGEEVQLRRLNAPKSGISLCLMSLSRTSTRPSLSCAQLMP